MEEQIFTLPPLPHLNISFFVSVPLLLAILIAFSVFYIIVTSILLYHWSAYGMKNKGIIFGQTIFMFVSLFLFVCAGVSLFYI